MVSTRVWLVTLGVIALVPILVLCVVNRFIPTGTDLKDPLGRPSDLSNQIIYSAYQFDVITARLDPKHQELSQSIQVLETVATDLAKLTDAAGRLTGLAGTVNESTSGVIGIAGGLPEKIQTITVRSDTAAPTVLTLAGAIQAVTNQLAAVNGGLQTVGSSLATLGPRAHSIAQTLSYIEEEAAHVRELGPLLALLGPAVNGPQTPAPQDPGQPTLRNESSTPSTPPHPSTAPATPGR
ncbi:hypothetical protein [Gordonia sp. N1V]|uniref:hypothetical protein n=1 Tax=Gordonia sp. N1V TaxID=3034163 RepID=UPI0023E28067|nr:hypothetical protein [Gordonia sp. N1V]MDF3281089.1 hypothetical protein [Gordonia sp. N1V]